MHTCMNRLVRLVPSCNLLNRGVIPTDTRNCYIITATRLRSSNCQYRHKTSRAINPRCTDSQDSVITLYPLYESELPISRALLPIRPKAGCRLPLTPGTSKRSMSALGRQIRNQPTAADTSRICKVGQLLEVEIMRLSRARFFSAKCLGNPFSCNI